MRLFPRWHSPEAVARELIAGLESGALVLRTSDLSVEDAITEVVRLTAEIARLDANGSPLPLTAATLAAAEARHPGVVYEVLSLSEQLYADLKSLESRRAELRHKMTMI